jgi:peptide deformylase
MDSLKTTHNARIASLTDQLLATNDEKIQRMKQSQIQTANRDYQQHIEQLELAAKQADILAEVVVFGVLELRKQP